MHNFFDTFVIVTRVLVQLVHPIHLLCLSALPFDYSRIAPRSVQAFLGLLMLLAGISIPKCWVVL